MMGEKKFRVNDLVKFNYSEVGEYVDENHTDRPLRNDEVVDLLNEQQATNDYLEESNSRLQVQLGETLRLVDKLKEENEQLKRELHMRKMGATIDLMSRR